MRAARTQSAHTRPGAAQHGTAQRGTMFKNPLPTGVAPPLPPHTLPACMQMPANWRMSKLRPGTDSCYLPAVDENPIVSHGQATADAAPGCCWSAYAAGLLESTNLILQVLRAGLGNGADSTEGCCRHRCRAVGIGRRRRQQRIRTHVAGARHT